MNYMLLLFLGMVMMGTILGVVSSNWLVLWVGMEMALFGFMFFLYILSSLSVANAAVRYFLIQSFASILLLPTGYYFFHSFMPIHFIMEVLLLLLLFLKLGAFPFHFWVMPVVYGVLMIFNSILLGPLKIIPLIVCFTLIQKSFNDVLYSVFILLSMGSMLAGSLLGNLVGNYRAVIGASSITHTGWLLIGCMVMSVWQYFFCYYILLLFFIWAMNTGNFFISSLSFIALSGLPPFLLFYAKVIMIWGVVSYHLFYLLLIVMVLSSIISLLFYLKFAFMFYLNMKLLRELSLQFFLFIIFNMMGLVLFLSLFF
uniref:NADH-ubiquinone oxidoreductase chain 2 n=1 Tax=Oreohelix idahoensis TaxID=2584915 RepID=A0A4Y5P347_9EUPU|nr:NADH dehydrogenase subunit 2 [Oreohelix idahoensis]QCW57657.1 NADH dehydrogenase subunit 2 [Oreohelix idahoensis]UKG20819.1 NADH dehydrogenase subunit 2 [Oreohelix idahoensis]